jgi:hypothetical protein
VLDAAQPVCSLAKRTWRTVTGASKLIVSL